MSQRVILVRHAMPVTSAEQSSKEWPLSDAARHDCVALARRLPTGLAPMVLTSSERKAVETAEGIALHRSLEVRVDARLGEVERPDAWVEDYRAEAVAYLRDGAQEGWESPTDVVARFSAAVDEALAHAGHQPLVVVNHGLALSLYAASKATVDLLPFWRALTFPDAWQLDLSTGSLSRI
ncbi:hypothetical protein AYO38_01890 [bacterium SCGC AG-212-C10]|nr:hypothetical protein AYO38_01890 [bacterium SCGC AG-212-C10]